MLIVFQQCALASTACDESLIELSLGINDVKSFNERDVMGMLVKTVNKIGAMSPNTEVIFTMPILTVLENTNSRLQNAYTKASSLTQTLLIDLKEAIRELVGDRQFYNDDIHPTQEGTVIHLSNILPKFFKELTIKPYEESEFIDLIFTYHSSKTASYYNHANTFESVMGENDGMYVISGEEGTIVNVKLSLTKQINISKIFKRK